MLFLCTCTSDTHHYLYLCVLYRRINVAFFSVFVRHGIAYYYQSAFSRWLKGIFACVVVIELLVTIAVTSLAIIWSKLGLQQYFFSSLTKIHFLLVKWRFLAFGIKYSTKSLLIEKLQYIRFLHTTAIITTTAYNNYLLLWHRYLQLYSGYQ